MDAGMYDSKWKEVSGFPEYEVHPTKGVRRKNSSRTLKGRVWLGYPKITLMRDGKKHERRIHRLVGEHFIPNPDNLPILNHKDSDRSNHSVDNLEWVNNSGNQLHRWETQKKGLKKMKYKQEYGLNKVASIKYNLFDRFGSKININSLPLENRMAIERIARKNGPGYRGLTPVKVNGHVKKLKVSVDDSDRYVPVGTKLPKTASSDSCEIIGKKQKETVKKANKAKAMLYKETKKRGLSKLSSPVGRAIDFTTKSYGKVGGVTARAGRRAMGAPKPVVKKSWLNRKVPGGKATAALAGLGTIGAVAAIEY